MKKATINKLFAVALSAAICIPALLTNPISSNAAPVSGNVVSGNTPTSGGSSSSSSSSSSSASTGSVVVNGKEVSSTIGGVFNATGVTGAVVTTPKSAVAAAVGLTDADIKAGTNVRAYIGDNCDKASKAALKDAAAASGKNVAAYVNVDIYTITKKGVVTKVESASAPVSMTFGIPAATAKAHPDLSVIAIGKDGKAVVMNDTDTNSRTVSIDTKVFGAFCIVY